MLLNEQVSPALVELDDADYEALVEDIHLFLSQIIERKLPKALQAEALRLFTRIDETLGEVSIH